MNRHFCPYPASQDILEKIEAKHGVSWHEVEEVFRGRIKLYRTHRADQYGEARYLALGRTDGGRYLAVFFVAVPPDQAKVITVRNMDEKEKNWFRGQRK